MKEERKLLEAVLCDSAEFEKCREESRRMALRAFRRERTLRWLARVSALAAAVVIAGALWFWPDWRMTPKRNQIASSPAPIGVVRGPEQTVEDDPLPRLSDAELLAAFPADSCFLAEVNGERILVFRDPELRKRYLE